MSMSLVESICFNLLRLTLVSDTKTITVKGTVCTGPNLAGPACATPFLPAVNNMSAVATSGVYKYFKCMPTSCQSVLTI